MLDRTVVCRRALGCEWGGGGPGRPTSTCTPTRRDQDGCWPSDATRTGRQLRVCRANKAFEKKSNSPRRSSITGKGVRPREVKMALEDCVVLGVICACAMLKMVNMAKQAARWRDKELLAEERVADALRQPLAGWDENRATFFCTSIAVTWMKRCMNMSRP